MDKLASEYKVLIVDDVPTNVMLVQAILKKEGYTLLTCDSGTKALRIANEKHPNLILLDIMMPEMDGYEVLQHLKSNPETTDIPVIIMSALSDMQSIVKGYQLGATEYVTKPFQREELVKRVAHRYELYSIKRIKAELENTIESRDTLYSVIAHDLRSPLGSLKMMNNAILMMVDKERVGDEVYEMIQMMNKTSEEIFLLLDNLLKWTKSQIGKLKVVYQDVDMVEVTEGVIEIFSMVAGLKKIGRSAVMMCFVPASFELLGMLLIAPKLMGITLLEAAIMGAVLAAVSPAVVVPRMVKLMEEGYGVKEGIPQLILAGASVDDVYVIVLFSTFVGMMQGKGASVISFVNIPVSIILGIAIGLLIGVLLACFFKKVHIRDTTKVLIILSISFLLVTIEDKMTTAITFSALIAIMFIGIGLQKKREVVTKRISVKYGKLWVGAEVFLFVLVGATVNIVYLGKVGIKAVLLIAGALVFRMLGVFVCLLGTSLRGKEKAFVMMAYTPKATVQAAIGGIPLSLGFACGDMVLTVAVLAIVLTAPLGAFVIDLSYKKLLDKR